MSASREPADAPPAAVLYNSEEGYSSLDSERKAMAEDLGVDPAEITDARLYSELHRRSSDAYADILSSLDAVANGSRLLVRGTVGCWDGTKEGGRVLDNASELPGCVRSCDRVCIMQDPVDGLVVVGVHHDGSNRFVVRRLTAEGEDYFYECGRDQSQAVHDTLMNKKYSTEITLI